MTTFAYLLKALADKYGVIDHPRHGKVVDVPKANWENRWNRKLQSIGCEIVKEHVDVYVVVPADFALPQNEADDAIEQPKQEDKRPRWTPEEDLLICQVVFDDSVKVTKRFDAYVSLATKKKLPTRAKSSFLQRKYYLKGKGRLNSPTARKSASTSKEIAEHASARRALWIRDAVDHCLEGDELLRRAIETVPIANLMFRVAYENVFFKEAWDEHARLCARLRQELETTKR